MKRTVLFAIIIFAMLWLAQIAAAQESHEFSTFEKKEAAETVYPKYLGNGSVGYSSTGGNIETNTLVGDLLLGLETTWTNHYVKAGITYGQVKYPDGEPIKNANSYFGNYKFEGYLTRTKKPYLWSLIGAQSDEFQGFWGRYFLEAGFGYSWFGISAYVLKTEIGYAFVDTNWINKVEIDDNEFHYWEPTHNGLFRLIASVPISKIILFDEEAVYRHNLEDEDDYMVSSSTGLSFKLLGNLSYKTMFSITYTNQPGPIEELDEYGNVVLIDDGDPLTVDPVSLVPAKRTAYGWTNALVYSFF